VTGATIAYTLDSSAYTGAVAKLGGVLKSGLLKAVGVALVEETQHRFDAGVDVWGVKWQPLLPAYAAIKRGPGILRASLMLQRSITFQVSGSTVSVGSNRVYAAVHQFGAVIKAKNGKGLAFLLGGNESKHNKGGFHLIQVQSVTIPARPYLGFGPKDERAVLEVLGREVTRIFGS
jgi:phage gpG-like protein